MSKPINLYGRNSGHWDGGVYVDPLDRLLRDRVAFHLRTKSFRGEPGRNQPGLAGWLPEDWRGVWRANSDDIDYVVWSYATPIAWHVASIDTWVVPNVKYSPTTSNHQSAVRGALGRLGVTYAEGEST